MLNDVFLHRKSHRCRHGRLNELLNIPRYHVSSSFPFTYINLSISSWLTIRLPAHDAQLYGMIQHYYSHLWNKSFSSNYANQCLPFCPTYLAADDFLQLREDHRNRCQLFMRSLCHSGSQR